MLATLFIIAAVFWGVALVRTLPTTLYRAELVSLGTVAAVFGGTWILFLLVAILGFSSGILIATILLLGSGLFLWNKARVRIAVYDATTQAVLTTTLVLAGSIFGYLIYTHSLSTGPGGWYSGGDTWGDIALHLSLTSSFAYTSHLNLHLPLFPHTTLTYPFLFDFLSGMLVRNGWSLQAGLGLTLFSVCMCILQLLFSLVHRIAGSARAGWLTILLFCGMGSPAGFWFYLQDHSRHTPGSMLTSFGGLDYSHITQYGLNVTNSITSLLLPQRGIALGLAVLLGICFLLYVAYTEEVARPRARLAAVVATGLLPLVHVHLMFVALIIWFVFLLMLLLEAEQSIWPWIRAVLLGSAIAAPQLIWQIHGAYAHGFTTYHIGWVAKLDQESLLTFWVKNIGLIPLVALGGAGYLYIQKKRFALAIGLAGLVLFILLNIVSFQPNIWDNIKLVMASYLIMSAGAAVAFDRWLQKPITSIAAAIFIFLSVATGGLSIARELARHDEFLNDNEIAFAEKFRQIIPADSVILTSWRHNNPIPTLTGRPIVMGYPGWLWTYGIDYSPVANDVQAMYAGSTTTPALLQKYAVQYVAFDPRGEYGIPTNELYFSEHYPVALSYKGWNVYRITSP